MEAGRTQLSFQGISIMLEGNSTLKLGSFEESFIETTPHVVVRSGTTGCHYHPGSDMTSGGGGYWNLQAEKAGRTQRHPTAAGRKLKHHLLPTDLPLLFVLQSPAWASYGPNPAGSPRSLECGPHRPASPGGKQ